MHACAAGQSGGKASVAKDGAREAGGKDSGGKDFLQNGTRVRIVRSYSGALLSRDEFRTGETTSFTHGWYYVAIDDSSQVPPCFHRWSTRRQRSDALWVCVPSQILNFRRHSIVVIGDEEDVGLGCGAPESHAPPTPRFSGAGKDSDGSRGARDGKDGKSSHAPPAVPLTSESACSCRLPPPSPETSLHHFHTLTWCGCGVVFVTHNQPPRFPMNRSGLSASDGCLK